MNIGERIRIYREAQKMSQEELGKIVGLSKNSIYLYEKGERIPQSDNLLKIATALQITPDMLFGTPAANVSHVKMLEIPLLDIATAASCGVGNGLSGVELQAGETVFIEYSDLQRYDDLRKPFAIHTEGDSMEGAGLEEGSVAVINPAEDVISGDMALVVWNDNWFVKWVIWNPDGSVELRSANPNYGAIKVDKEYAADSNWFRIVGKVVSIIKRTKPRRAF
ncbi:LexA family transcriptional regulator [Cloacibacillus sp. An23]|uniref:helix-turn-helix domain-containing protein n=1 Tax=Cloacibacillus sp. An23 TaxID=1965591 RepID=UPI000B36F79E|nr:LexA family transcriptional regulator [Cloacibacillus sp. An23]OUO92594.1 hypothetical protein B5F39_10575 [Cloacibacillus sp. An23]